MQLIKFCRPEHNILNGAQLRLGTLYGYRKIENLELQDGDEGKYRLTVEIAEEITLELRLFNLIFQGVFAYGSSEVMPPSFLGTIEAEATYAEMERKEDRVIIKRAIVELRRNVPNCLLFCMSMLDDPGKNPFAGYQDHWSISADGAGEFSARLSGLIMQQASLSAFDDFQLSQHSASSVGRLGILYRHRPVRYGDRNIVITSENVPKYDDFVELLADIAFIKPTEFAAENEYRFSFLLGDGKRIYSPAVESVLVSLNPFAGL